MSPTKGELEWDQQEYYSHLRRAKAALTAQRHQDAVNAAVLALHHVDGMMQFEKRYESASFDRIEAIDIILMFAPALLDTANLDVLGAALKNQRRIDKNASADLADDLAKAKRLLWDAYYIWSLLEIHRVTSVQDIHDNVKVAPDKVRMLLDRWIEMNLVCQKREPNGDCVSLVTHFGVPSVGKCSNCGVTATLEKVALLVDSTCQACGVFGSFVMLESTSLDNN